MNSLANLYELHFGLHQQPFSLTPNTRFFLNSQGHSAVLQTVVLALDGLEGFIKITGEVGTGKTLLCRKLISTLDDRYVTALILNPMLSPEDLYRAFADELGISLRVDMHVHEILKGINCRLIHTASRGKRVVLIIDEAQAMPRETLEALRLLTNLETESRKLLQVVLFGQPELDRLMDLESLRQLKQRITVQECLRPFDSNGVASYIRHRVEVAGYDGPGLFYPAAIRLIHRRSGGVPRLINVLSHKAMLAAFGKGDPMVGKSHVMQAVIDTESCMKKFRLWKKR